MYGPVPTPPARRRAVRAGIMLLRIVLAAVPVVSVGMLSWIPMLWPALVHRRSRDWLLFGGAAAASIGGMALVGTMNDWRSHLGMVILLADAVAASAYFLAVDLNPRRAPGTARPADLVPGPPAPPGYPPFGIPRQDRIGEVRAGLDELSAYLRQQDGS
ncbi:hypothetical protein [Kitasatospora sp. Root107]|uniref:hypothetical protein n=1 Tax=Kitasatospora sp. Root107 TaxID=1736424 RepID=UPI00070E16ED|nr:hypothetical protein [Kitasatospora sp. Root107]KQV15964.1 hypothetical protein ASC99_28905 [Kitasatospora sp. Root107]